MRSGVVSIIIGTLLSKGIGVLPEVLFAFWFGTTDVAAAFRIAQTGFLLPTHALVGDTLSAGLLPLYRQMMADDINRARALRLVASLYGIAFSAVVTIPLYIYADAMVALIAPGASEPALALATRMLHVMALATPFYVLSTMLGYIEAGHGRYGSIALRPVLLNIGSIAGAALAALTGAYDWLALGLLLSYVVFFVWTAVELRRIDRFTPDAVLGRDVLRGIGRRFILNLAPLLTLPLLAQANVLVERVVSSCLGAAVVPALDYARFISDPALTLTAVPLGILTMSTQGGSHDGQARRHVQTMTAFMLMLSFPAAVFIGCNSEDIVRLVFARGKFDAGSVATTSQVLQGLAFGLGPTLTSYYLVKALNAQLRNKEAVLITAAGCVGNSVFDLALWPVLGPAALGWGTAVNGVVMLALCVQRLGIWRDHSPLLAVIACGAVADVALYLALASVLAWPALLPAHAVLTAALWLGTTALSPSVRRALSPLLAKLPGRLGQRIHAT